MVLGNSGAGKSTLAREIGARLGLPAIHLDAHFWQPGWVETPKDAFAGTVAELASGEGWVIDGNYRGSMDVRLARATAVIVLDVPIPICLWRVIARYLRHRGETRPDVGPGCPEKIDWEFVRWICHDYPRHSRPGILRRLAECHEGLQIITLRSPREVRRFLASLP
jgi:adenylate kinase family enzyme